MKKVFYLSYLLVFLTQACSERSTMESPNGVYKLKSTSSNDGKSENTRADLNQYKIYTPTHYFLISSANDSNAFFGLGTYDVNGDTIIEHNLYNSISLDTAQDLKLILAKTASGYGQEIPSILLDGINYRLKEVYDTVSISGPSSKMDGLWKRGNCMLIKGQDTTKYTFSEYLVFQSGHFIKASRIMKDSIANVFGNNLKFGTFEFDKNILSESCVFASDPKMIGVKSAVSIILDENKGAMLQIISYGVDKPTDYVVYNKIK